MSESLMLGIDCGGTHTDAALVSVRDNRAELVASAKTATRHDNLPSCVMEAVRLLASEAGDLVKRADRVTLGTTLEINALVEGKADKVGLAISAGPGLDPVHFTIGDCYCIIPGGLDHRGVEVDKLYTDELEKEAAEWPSQGVQAVACVGKFSPRNPAHEDEMAKAVKNACNLPVTLGHTLSGKLNFPRRIATAYYNAAVARINEEFLTAVEKALASAGVHGALRLLKADGGAIPFSQSRREPVQSILSGPAASVMGCLALWPDSVSDCSLLLDMGGTTTDMALLLDGSPVVDRQGMNILGRRTLVRSLASVSIGIGGDSLLAYENGKMLVGPERIGPAMAFGGAEPTLLDALNLLDGEAAGPQRGDVGASISGLRRLASGAGLQAAACRDLAAQAADTAVAAVVKAAFDLVERVNSRPVYTLAGLKAAREARPARLCLVGGPAECIRKRMEEAFGIAASVAAHSDVANAIGAALTRPTASLEIYADTGKGELWAPALNLRERIAASCALADVERRALDLMHLGLAAEGVEDARVEVVEADMFATLDDYGRGARDMRVTCQATPGIVSAMF